MLISLWILIFLLISWETVPLLLVEDKQNVKFRGVVRCELYMYSECISHVIAYLKYLIHTQIQPYYTNPSLYNILQDMMENQAKEELIEMKSELE